MLKKVVKALIYFLLFIVLITISYLTSEFVLSRMSNKILKEQEAEIEVFIKSNGVHTDIVLPIFTDTIDWTKFFPFENTLSKSKDFNYIAIGWGDKGFYIDTPEWKDLKVSTAIIAASGIGNTLIHTTFYKEIFEDYLTFSYKISRPQYARIVSIIKQNLKYSDGKTILVKTDAQYGQNDAFYEAFGSYSIFHTCNTWTNNLLKEAQMPSSKWLAFDKGILFQFRKVKK